MFILLCVNRDLPSNVALNALIPQLAGHRLHIWLSDKVGKPGKRCKELTQIAFFEQGFINDFFFPWLEQQPHRAEAPMHTFKEFETYRQIPVETCNDVNSEAGLARLAQLAPDLIVSIRFGVIFKAAAIAIPKYGILNLHSGLLPQYRGVIASFWALRSGEKNYGCTLHRITDAKIDYGPIIATAALPAAPGKCLLSHVVALYTPGVELIVKEFRKLEKGQPSKGYEQKKGSGQYYTFPQEEDFAIFSKLGYNLCDPQAYSRLLQAYIPFAF